MEIYKFDYTGEIGYYCQASLKYHLQKAGDKPVRMKLNSVGGSVLIGLSCADMIRTHGNVTMEIVGICASAATLLTDAAKEVEMLDDSFFLAHNCSGRIDIYGYMTKEQIQEKIKELSNQTKSQEAIDLVVTQKYMNRTGKTMEEVTTLMKENRWITAIEAKQWGFVDKIIPTKEKKPIAEDQVQMMAMIGLPALPAQKPEATPVLTLDSEKSPGILAAFIEGWNSFVNKGSGKITLETNSLRSNNSILMRTTETTIMGLLGVPHLEESEDKVQLSSEHITKIEQELKQKGTDLQTMKGERDQYLAVLDGLDDSIKNADTPEKKLAAFNTFKARIPVIGIGVQHKYSEGETDYSDCAIDPINFEED